MIYSRRDVARKQENFFSEATVRQSHDSRVNTIGFFGSTRSIDDVSLVCFSL